jgi:hypothetical protein
MYHRILNTSPTKAGTFDLTISDKERTQGRQARCNYDFNDDSIFFLKILQPAKLREKWDSLVFYTDLGRWFGMAFQSKL